jgi:hypothetical protein
MARIKHGKLEEAFNLVEIVRKTDSGTPQKTASSIIDLHIQSFLSQ